MNCDRIASAYRSIEYIAFAHRLEENRFEFLAEADRARHALLLGEGDGRFLVELARRNPTVLIDCVELSRGMVELASQRLRASNIPNPERVRFIQSDARLTLFSAQRYDLIVTHFFFDCFSTADVTRLIEAVRLSCRPGAAWLISEFQQPPNGWRKWHAAVWLKTMYLFFGLITQLQTTKLPDFRNALLNAGFTLHLNKTRMAGLICSQLWRFPSS